MGKKAHHCIQSISSPLPLEFIVTNSIMSVWECCFILHPGMDTSLLTCSGCMTFSTELQLDTIVVLHMAGRMQSCKLTGRWHVRSKTCQVVSFWGYFKYRG